MYEIIILPPAERFIKTLNKPNQIKLLDYIDELAIEPRKGKELLGRLKGLRSRRVDNFRIIYKIEELKLIIFVLRAGHTGNIYSKNFGNNSK